MATSAHKEKLTKLQKMCIARLRSSVFKNQPTLVQLPTGFGKTRVVLRALVGTRRIPSKKLKLIILRKKDFPVNICPWYNELEKAGVLDKAILTSHRMFKRNKDVRKYIDFRRSKRKITNCRIIFILDESHRSLKCLKKILKIKSNSSFTDVVIVSATPVNPVTTPFADDNEEALRIKKSENAHLSFSDEILKIPEKLEDLKPALSKDIKFSQYLVGRDDLFHQLKKFYEVVSQNSRMVYVKEMNFVAGHRFKNVNECTFKNNLMHNFLLKQVSKNEKTLIFCHYLKSAEGLENYLKKRLGGKVAYANNPKDRHALECFAGKCKNVECRHCSDLQFLIVTDRHSESIDLQAHCRVLVHYELYWSPTVMVQRIGRLWRLGHKGFRFGYQQSPNFPEVYHLKTPHSIEMEIFIRLFKRLENIHKYNSFNYLDFKHIIGNDLLGVEQSIEKK